MGSSGKSESKAYSQPWYQQQGYLKKIYERAEGLYRGGELEMYPGQMYADQDPYTVASRKGMGEYGMRLGEQGTEGTRLSEQEMMKTAGGGYMKDNPYLDQTYKRATRAFGRKYADIVGGGIAGRFGTGGRTGSPAEMRALQGAQAELGTSMSGLAADIYGKAYETERGRQFQAAGMLPSISAARVGERMGGYGAAEAAGMSREERDQVELDELIQRFDWTQQEPYERLTRYAGLIGAPVTTSSSSSSSRQGSGLLGFMGI